jgi:hypothetical protein
MDIKQVEFNTISVSFGALSQGADALHRCVNYCFYASTNSTLDIFSNLLDISTAPTF